ncbi:5-formyltetrahydrofolate cyclo-ligase [Aeromicrobium endophyticum]|uniref:5-formyltetrahydrofolate cyclo-ligase n=1 Tax=Aeromicrobium endophyticum TaxID=2292704 RepID=A0A371PDB4_9ACTN|nr:5-formyltetrahydrofolate cyclo-ligase [Aeromicrobium endophyticum]REK73894.1 5-formyltetrahydrofolate cyclo-ligase [Aeromicrobium endophyticum]
MTKARQRDELLARRRTLTPAQRAEAADAIAQHVLTMPLVARARRVACYLSMPSEPGTAPLIAALHDRGVEVIVPISLADHSLDWVAHDPTAALVTTALGIPEPAGPHLGADALATCSLVIVPALAVDHAGHRLGRGAGYYDRALAGVAAPVCALVFTHELLPEVPHEPHDVPVQMAVAPSGLFRVPS